MGIIALLCFATSAGAAFMGELQTAWASAMLRISLVLGALWLALPTRSRPAAWAGFSVWWLAGLIVFAVLLPRIKYILPILLVGVFIGWLLRPRRRR